MSEAPLSTVLSSYFSIALLHFRLCDFPSNVSISREDITYKVYIIYFYSTKEEKINL